MVLKDNHHARNCKKSMYILIKVQNNHSEIIPKNTNRCQFVFINISYTIRIEFVDFGRVSSGYLRLNKKNSFLTPLYSLN